MEIERRMGDENIYNEFKLGEIALYICTTLNELTILIFIVFFY